MENILEKLQKRLDEIYGEGRYLVEYRENIGYGANAVAKGIVPICMYLGQTEADALVELQARLDLDWVKGSFGDDDDLLDIRTV